MAESEPVALWSPEAIEDLVSIWSYLAREASQTVADRTLADMEAVANRLASWPQSGRARDELIAGLRSATAGNHVVFYRVTTGERVEIVRVIDGRRDLAAIFDR